LSRFPGGSLVDPGYYDCGVFSVSTEGVTSTCGGMEDTTEEDFWKDVGYVATKVESNLGRRATLKLGASSHMVRVRRLKGVLM